MQVLVQLEELGYESHIDGEQIKLIWKGSGKPDPSKICPLLEQIKARRNEAIIFLRQRRTSFYECYRLISKSMDRIAKGYIRGTIDRLKYKAPELWIHIRETEKEVDHAALIHDVGTLREALRGLEHLWSEAGSLDWSDDPR